eukprot:6055592-Ditylum_brightwellii.AAC.1
MVTTKDIIHLANAAHNSTDTSVAIKMDQLLHLNRLPNKFKGFQYSMSSFCDDVVTCIKTLEAAGGQDTQTQEKLVETLTTSPSTKFNSDIRSHCSACCANSTPLDIDMLMNLAHLIYQTILLKKEWPSTNDIEADKVSKKCKSLNNIAALLTKYNTLKSKYKHMKNKHAKLCSCDAMLCYH